MTNEAQNCPYLTFERVRETRSAVMELPWFGRLIGD